MTISLFLEILLIFFGIFGYYASIRNHKYYFKRYLIVVAIINLILLAGGLLEIVFYFLLNSLVDDHWKGI